MDFKIMMELMRARDMITELKESTNTLNVDTFIPFICMLMEEYCLANKEDVVEMASDIATLVSGVNDAIGKYKGETE